MEIHLQLQGYTRALKTAIKFSIKTLYMYPKLITDNWVTD